MVARAIGGDRQGWSLAEGRRAAGFPPLRLRRGRQDDAGAACRRGRRGIHGLRRLHRKSRAGHARQGLRRRDDDPRADLSRQRGRGRPADLHAQRRRPGVPRRPHRHRRMLDGRRRAGARPPVVRQADPGARRPVQLPPVKGGGFFTESRARRDADRDPSPGGRQSYHPPVRGRARGRRTEARRLWRDADRAAASAIDAAQVMAADQVLVGVNRTRRAFNRRLRELNGFAGPLPVERRQAGLPAQRPDEGPDQRRPVAGRGPGRRTQGFRPPDRALRGRGVRATPSRSRF